MTAERDGQGRVAPQDPRLVAVSVLALLLAVSLPTAFGPDGAPGRDAARLATPVLLVLIAGGLWLWVRRQAALRARLLAEIGEGAARQRTILDSTMDAILTLNPEGVVETVNAAGVRLFGFAADELVGRDVGQLLDLEPEQRRTLLDQRSASGDLARGVVRELTARHRSGAEIPVDVALRGMLSPSGVNIVAVVRDSSERRRADALKDQFIATVSHELRTPLTSIAGSLGLLKGGAGGPLPSGAHRLLEIAETNSARLVRLINDILDVEKIRAGGGVPLVKKPLRLRMLLEAARDGTAPMAFGRNVVLVLRPVDPGLWIMADRDRMMQVMTNLLSNAVKASPEGGEVIIEARADGPRGVVRIVDAGPGVPESFRDKIFERFARIEDPQRAKIEGTGLGLTIARDIVRLHDGRLDFENNSGGGAAFFFDAPLTDPPPLEGALELDEGGAPRILICEDDPLIGEVLTDQIEMFGYAVEVAASANAARHALHVRRYDVLLLDIRLPDSDGLTLIRALRAAPETSRLPIIAMSGSFNHREAALALGVVDWLAKPIRMEDLERAIAAALRTGTVNTPLILHVEADPDLIEIARARLGRLAQVISAGSLAAAREALSRRRPDLVVLEIDLPDGDGAALLSDLETFTPAIPALVYTSKDVAEGADLHGAAVLVKGRSDLADLSRVAEQLLTTAP